ncbi:MULTISPECIES: DNA-binding protein [unclassified Colwellia]|uniref:DNA-binding protein n=1 Tax=unclassified Colwellia TaxID=196834 RepID=UPI0015F5AC0A|nr:MULTISPECIES: DNA-binding protein [unclassified Colwellia]MBA6231742.1 DNA-binding protein [Colwellia sp. MB02u-7]MBA6235697.1 DNA-binding protein [Colwellia sp. MB02u-11]MBA6254768.1 DNA-binding protein [Colwellia sp. MB3u-28]MBA6259307.1 DNA-binding protein [Colwellia sp. MB3u-41]MBA6298786.1 DNA-binding protein [Colwellia sp. MB3u-22]
MRYTHPALNRNERLLNGMSRSFLRQSRMEGNRENRTPDPPFIKIGRAVCYLKDDLDNWLDSFFRMQHLGQKSVGGEHA